MIESISNIWIYDLEVFAHDWLGVFQSVDNGDVRIFHNDRQSILEFIKIQKPILCGFNNKHYDDYIMLSILSSGDPEQVKEHNDFIIGGNQGYLYPPIQGLYKGNYFESFDLKDDLPLDLSLKAIEGNMGKSIVESEIDFTITHKLSAEELAETIHYCKCDVANTYELFKARKGYLNGKLQVAKVGDMTPVKALSMTNPKLTAVFLNAKKLDNPNDGEFIYNPPPAIKLEKYTEVLDFYLAGIDYDKKLSIQAKDLQLDFGWGGLHGAIPNYRCKSTKDFTIKDADVGSYYPTDMLKHGHYSKAIPCFEAYKKVYETRLEAKHKGDDVTASALKLVLNSCYGAMKNKYNDLYSPASVNHVCISCQLFILMLIEQLEKIPTLKIIQVNTDGIMFGNHPDYDSEVEKAVLDWEKKTLFNMEYTEIHEMCCQKDVNNYVMRVGATYLVNPDGTRQYTKEDKNKAHVKGGYVSLYQGGDFRNNSLVIVHKAVADYFLNGTDPAETINTANNILDFQMICKTGHTYDGCVYEYAGERKPVQRANRVYAGKDKKAGTLYKVKGERYDKIASIPDNCIIDNTGSEVTLEDIDKGWYIDLARKRINDYLGVKPDNKKSTSAKKKEKKEMAKKEETGISIYRKLAKARIEFLASGVKQTGKNMHLAYKYFTLDDIVPVATKVMADNDLIAVIRFDTDYVYMDVVDMDNPANGIHFKSPMVEIEIPLTKSGGKSMNEAQALGCVQSYLRRYMWLMVLDIVEVDVFDMTQGNDNTETKKPTPPPTAEERKEIAEEISKPTEDKATDAQKASIKRGLEKLQDADPTSTEYILAVVNEVKSGISSSRAEAIISDIGSKLYPEE